MKPKYRFRGQLGLGRGIDERGAKANTKLRIRHNTGPAPAAPLGSNAGGSGGGEEPALPESCVRSLNKAGAEALDGALVLEGSGGTEITQSDSSPHFVFSSPTAVWKRISTTIIPNNSSDRIAVTASNSLGAAQVTAYGENKPALVADSALGYAIIASSAANLGLRIDGVRDCKLLSSGSITSAPSGYARWYNLTDGRAYIIDQNGNQHDLAVQHKQCFGGQQLAGGAAGESWEYVEYPTSASAAQVAASANQQFDFGSGIMTDAYGRWSWQASYAESPPGLTQSQMATGAAFRKFGDGSNRDGNCRVVIKARLRVNDPDNFDAILLILNSDSSSAYLDILGQLSSGIWAEVTLAPSGIDVSSWEASLRASVLAQGRQHTEVGDYQTTIDIERICVEQWVN